MLKTTRRWLTPLATGLAAFALGVVLAPALLKGDGPPEDPLAEFDRDFRGYYATGRAETLARFGPIIRVEQDMLILLHAGGRREVSAIPPLYHELKAVSHIPLAFMARLDNTPDGPIDDATLADLDRMRDGIAAVVPTLDGRKFSPQQLDRQRAIIRDTLTILDTFRTTKRQDRQAVTRFARAQGPLVLADAADAVAAQYQGYDACIRSWRKIVPAGEWERLRVIVCDHQMPRDKNAAVQYFAKLLGVPGEGLRLVYAEAITDETKALNLLATHQLDTDIGVAFFDDPDRMMRDLLGDAATAYLEAHRIEPIGANDKP